MYVTGESLTQNQISLIVNGKARVEKLEMWERLAAALDMPDRARVRLGLAPREYEPATGGEPDPVLADIETIRQSLTDALDQCTVNEPGVADWEQAALAYGRATRHTAPSRLLHGLSVDFAELAARVRARQPARLQRRLSYVTAQFAGLVSLELTNLERYGAARRWGRTARMAADEAGDPALSAWVRAQDAYAAFYEGDNYLVSAEVARQAQQLSGRTPSVGAALSAALEARATALVGDERAALAALARAEELLGGLDGESVTRSAFGYDEAQLRFHEGNALTHLGQTERAWIAQQRALELYPESDTLDRTLVHLDRAMSLIQSGDVNEGAAYALDKLLKLAPGQRSDLILARARRLATEVGRHSSKIPAARDLRTLIISHRAPKTRHTTRTHE
jgi:tetratricopeptide (TPR) repeat protein